MSDGCARRRHGGRSAHIIKQLAACARKSGARDGAIVGRKDDGQFGRTSARMAACRVRIRFVDCFGAAAPDGPGRARERAAPSGARRAVRRGPSRTGNAREAGAGAVRRRCRRRRRAALPRATRNRGAASIIRALSVPVACAPGNAGRRAPPRRFN
ncbi:hypothetical protein C7S16_1219 [Burkholderia thailandensis]|uniref:Uncharacterized protein n=1 Tax=Burkholderia thailandensis TaxID=57975 RepID=A0AAW9D5L9_BURTH|nr:hypothetical protein [Burkholderia thailandensis]MDW9257261.1 hypothetical protein [Burkholderia thailandensis]